MLKWSALLFLLPFLEIFWANLHIYFFLGLIIIGAFWIEALAEQPRNSKKIQLLSSVGVLCIIAACTTPFGWNGLLYPFSIFKNYGYGVLENQSIFTIMKQGLIYPNVIVFCSTAGVLLVGFGTLVGRRWRNFWRAEVLLMIVFVIAGMFAVRNLALLGFCGVALVPLLFVQVQKEFFNRVRLSKLWLWIMACLVIFITLLINRPRLVIHSQDVGVGLFPGVESAAHFMQDHDLRGPLFNNFDSGGYLIWTLYPTKVFVDNRPEAYPVSFFSERYISMQLDEAVWKKELAANKFTTIFFHSAKVRRGGSDF